ncbi:MAG: undecaprenyldiphospho-muramoylpentapeptide beta-N-acetylglucosaminyltransferase [Candidatus Moraniibacteriota bacterium]|nr:MAG: undecaprenyldiphospho-muramoylpentapeptide beta-N-acetylglucosaminyltransferase [Candidatus Moranbacteria bacterium]
MEKRYRIVLAGGGTGGHIFPLVSIAKELRGLLGPETEFLYLGPTGALEKKIIGESGIASKKVLSGKWRRPFDFRNMTDIFKNIAGFFQSLYFLYRYMPEAVFSKGAYAAVPVVFAAWIYRIPLVTHDSDATPGVANKIMGKFANRIAVAYPSAARFFEARRVAITGNPVREGIRTGSASRARERFGCPPGKLAIFFVGGSLGARAVNAALIRILPRLLEKFFVIHQTGAGNYEEVTKQVNELALGDLSGRYFFSGFLDTGELSDALALADLVVSRAGANVISEIAAVGKPAILIPLPSAANDEQRMNAYEMARVGGALVLEEGNLGENMLFGKIEQLLMEDQLRLRMGEAMKTFDHEDAGLRIAEGIVSLIREKELRKTLLDRVLLWRASWRRS